LRHLDLMIPRQGAGQLLQQISCIACQGEDPLFSPLTIGLYLNDLIPTNDTLFTDLVHDDATLAPISLNPVGVCTGNMEGPSLNPDEWALIFDQQTWTLGADPGAVTVYGGYVMMDSCITDEGLLGVGRFATPIPLAVDDILKLTAVLKLLGNVV